MPPHHYATHQTSHHAPYTNLHNHSKQAYHVYQATANPETHLTQLKKATLLGEELVKNLDEEILNVWGHWDPNSGNTKGH